MTNAVFAIAVNISIATLFTVAFLVIGFSHRSQRRILLFALSYAIGILTPTSELLITISDYQAPLMALSWGSLVTAFAALAIAMSAFFRRRPPWLPIGLLLILSFALRWAIWGGVRGDPLYEFLYQLPFAAMLATCAVIALTSARDRWSLMLGGMLCMLALHFLLKPVAAAWFYPGATARDYTHSTYALVSQAVTGVMLVAMGLMLMLVVMRHLLISTRLQADTDMLTGVFNRRGFDDRASAWVAKCDGRGTAVMMVDIDRFKSINDRFGHAAGDEVIRALATLLIDQSPAGSMIGRLGGEEFALIWTGADAEKMGGLAESIRARFASIAFAGLPADIRVTISAGVAEHKPGDTLSDMMRRSDGALYVAKRGGRNRVVLDRAAA